MSGNAEGLLSEKPRVVNKSLNEYIEKALSNYTEELGGHSNVETDYEVVVELFAKNKYHYNIEFLETDTSISLGVYLHDGFRQDEIPVRTLGFVLNEGSRVKFHNLMQFLEGEMPTHDELQEDSEEYFFSLEKN